jgi:hypothetical protein
MVPSKRPGPAGRTADPGLFGCGTRDRARRFTAVLLAEVQMLRALEAVGDKQRDPVVPHADLRAESAVSSSDANSSRTSRSSSSPYRLRSMPKRSVSQANSVQSSMRLAVSEGVGALVPVQQGRERESELGMAERFVHVLSSAFGGSSVVEVIDVPDLALADKRRVGPDAGGHRLRAFAGVRSLLIRSYWQAQCD